jgi:hypothetical protein
MINDTLLLLQILGPRPIYTTNVELIKNLSKEKVHELYLHARINKIGYTYLRALEASGIINCYPMLENELRKQREVFNKHVQSIKIISEVLTDLGIEHVFIKTIYDFPVLPSDIDVLIRCKLSREIIKTLENKGFVWFDKGPHFVSLYNTHVDPYIPRDKMSYDIDIYDEISLNYLVYLDKEYCFNNFKIDSSNKVKVPLPEYELLIQLNHSVFEHLYTLLHFYTFIRLLPNIDIVKLKKLAKVTRSEKVLSYASLITLFIVKNANLTIEEKQLNTLENLANKELLVNINSVPYRFTLTQISQVLFEKTKNFHYLRHMLSFMLLLFLYPKQITHVVNQIVARRTRQTY